MSQAKVLLAVRTMSDSQLINALFMMAEAHPETFAQVLLAGDGKMFHTPQGTITLTAADMRQVTDYVRAGEKVQAIKLVRAVTGFGLKDAKDFVEGDYGLNMSSPL